VVFRIPSQQVLQQYLTPAHQRFLTLPLHFIMRWSSNYTTLCPQLPTASLNKQHTQMKYGASDGILDVHACTNVNTRFWWGTRGKGTTWKIQAQIKI
jgi:hypothetical protein